MFKSFIKSKKGLLLSSIIFIMFLILVLPYFAKLSEVQTNSSFSPDTGFFYSSNDFYQAMEDYQESGRDFYILMRWTFDVVWPFVYYVFFVSIIANLVATSNRKKERLFLLLPLFAVAMDFVENTFASINVGIYPLQSIFLLRVLQVASLLKWLLIIIVLFLILYLCIMRVIKSKKNG
jgi:hypothetical protein